MPTPSDSITPELLLAEAPILYRYALMRVDDHHHAEELVQDCLLTALRKADGFDHRSSLRTWLMGILRHKTLDHLRKAYRTPTMRAEGMRDQDDHHPLDDLFDRHGSWKIDPSASMEFLQDSPVESARRSDIMKWIHECLTLLPSHWKKLFLSREIDQLPVADAAAIAGVHPASAPVLLTRARHQVRDCLQRHAVE